IGHGNREPAGKLDPYAGLKTAAHLISIGTDLEAAWDLFNQQLYLIGKVAGLSFAESSNGLGKDDFESGRAANYVDVTSGIADRNGSGAARLSCARCIIKGIGLRTARVGQVGQAGGESDHGEQRRAISGDAAGKYTRPGN